MSLAMSLWTIKDQNNRVEYSGMYDFKKNDYTNRVLMTSACNIPRRVVSDKTINGVRVLELVSLI